MKRHILKILAVGILMALPSVASAATNGFATTNVNMRSGPSTRYPAVVVVPAGAPIVVNGCLDNVNWCDVSFARGRGWVSGSYIQVSYRQNRTFVSPQYYRPMGIPTITFDVDTYWQRYYRDRDFYSERGRWRDWDYRRTDAPPRYDTRRPEPVPPRWDDRRPEPRYDPRYYDNRRPVDPRWDDRYRNDDGYRYDNRRPDRPNWDDSQNRDRYDQNRNRDQRPEPQQQAAPPQNDIQRRCTQLEPCPWQDNRGQGSD